MLGSIYSGLSGMIAYSKGLDVISNNVANLNTPGYKGSDILFRDLLYDQQATGDNQFLSSDIGNGVQTKGTSTRFTQGDIQSTGNSTDLAVNGNGLFIIKDDDNVFYTRAGQFEFNDENFLTVRGTDARVQGFDLAGNLTDISLRESLTNPAVATSNIDFENNLSTGSASHELSTVTVIDSAGEEHDLKFTFTNNNAVTPRSWLIDIEDSTGNTIATGLEIRYSGDGSPAQGFDSVSFDFTPAGANTQNIVINMGEPGSFTGSTSFSAGVNSTLSAGTIDGVVTGALLSASFDNEGLLTVNYSNGESTDIGSIALAWFKDLQSLTQVGQSQFIAPQSAAPTVARAGDDVMGSIVDSSIEISNVDLTKEFTDLIIMQRGFQASSQILTASNEILEQLINIGKGS